MFTPSPFVIPSASPQQQKDREVLRDPINMLKTVSRSIKLATEKLGILENRIPMERRRYPR